jgi:microcystin-dependent protein
LDPGALPGFQGGSLPHNNMMPYLTMNWIIALAGIFPARQ